LWVATVRGDDMLYTPVNNVFGLRLASPRSVGGSSLVLASGQGARLTVLPTRITVVTAGTYGTSAELLTIFGVTAVSGDTLTITGPLEGTVDHNYAAGDYADLRVTAGYINDLNVGGTSGLPSGDAGQVLIIDDTTASFSSIIEVNSASSLNATGTNAVVLNASNSIASGSFSLAIGENTVAGGEASLAAGSGSGSYGFGSVGLNESLAIGNNSLSEGGSATYGFHAHGEGTNSSGAGDASHVEGENCWSGPTPWACTLANIGGVTVATITGTEAATWFAHNDFVALILLMGGSGKTFTTAQVNTSVPSGGNSIITLKTLATNATSGQIFVPGKVKNGHAGGLNSFADLPNKFARSDGGFYNVAGSPYTGSSGASSTPLSVKTTDGTETELKIGGGMVGLAGVTPVRFAIAEGFTYGFELSLVARKSDGSAGALMRRQGLIHRDGGVVAMIGNVGTIGADINTLGWVVAITADNVNKSLKITGTGVAATTILWFAELRTWEVGLPTGPFRVASLT
jgi:hypothetical protein